MSQGPLDAKFSLLVVFKPNQTSRLKCGTGTENAQTVLNITSGLQKLTKLTDVFPENRT